MAPGDRLAAVGLADHVPSSRLPCFTYIVPNKPTFLLAFHLYTQTSHNVTGQGNRNFCSCRTDFLLLF